jgi:hypothetical protein
MTNNKTLEDWLKDFHEYATNGGGVTLDNSDCIEILQLLIELENSRKTGINVIGYVKETCI